MVSCKVFRSGWWNVPEHRDASKSSHELLLEPRAKVVPSKHNIFTHFPKTGIAIFVWGRKVTRASCRTHHKVPSERCDYRNNHRCAVLVQNLATQWIQSFPCKTKSSQEIQKNLMKFLEPRRKPKVIYTDNSLELGKSCEELSCNHCTSTPHRSETNGIAERAARRVKEGTSVVLLRSGLGKEWWADTMECYCYLRNMQDKLSDGKHLLKGGSDCPSTDQQFRVERWSNITLFLRDQSRLHQFGAKVLPNIFLGYALYAVGIWKGDIQIADIEELEEMDASEIHARRLNENEMLTPMSGENFIFRVADGIVKISGGEQRLRTSTLTQERSERGEEQEIL